MNKIKEQSILHDAYFNRKPVFAVLFSVRLALLCVLSAATLLSLNSVYLFGLAPVTLAATAVSSTIVFFLLASLLPSRFVYGGLVIIGGISAFIFRETIWEWCELFWDKLMLFMDSRLLSTDSLVINNINMLKSGVLDEKLAEGSLAVFILLGIIISFLYVSSCRTRIHAAVPAVALSLLLIPSFIAERARFTPEFIFFAVAVIGLQAISSGYKLDRSLVFDNKLDAIRSFHRSENAYAKRTRFFIGIKKLRNDGQRYYKYTANAVASVIVSGILLTAIAFSLPDGKGFDYDDIVNKAIELGNSISESVGGLFGYGSNAVYGENYFSYSDYGDDSGDISIAAPSSGNRPVMKVMLARNDIPVYLRGDIGVDFTGDGWTGIRDVYQKAVSSDGTKYSEKLKDFYPEIEYQNFRKLINISYDPDDFMPLQTVKVNYSVNTKVIFQPLAPYELNYKNNRFISSFGDTVYRSSKTGSYIKTYESLALTPNIGTNSDVVRVANSVKLAGVPDPASVQDIENYRSYINDVYMNGNAAVRRFTDELKEKLSLTSGDYNQRYDIALAICDYFRDNFSYSLTVDNGEDALRGFLYETREGHCALFATAMTLSLRELGIPARYVTGYVVSGEGTPVEGGYQYTVRENNLHAWVEVYFRNIGWLPFDPTAAVAGFEGGMLSEDNPSEGDNPEVTEPAATETTDVSPEETDVPEDGNEDEASDSEETDEPAEEEESEADTLTPPDETETTAPSEERNLFLEILPVLIIVLASAAVIAIILLFIRAVNTAEKKAFRLFGRKPPYEAVSMMYRLLLKLLEMADLAPGNEFFTDYAERVDRTTILKGKNVFMADVMPVFQKCEFGNKDTAEITEEERRAVYRLLKVVYSETVGRFNPFKRFFIKISLFF